jgi:hypothetical protein
MVVVVKAEGDPQPRGLAIRLAAGHHFPEATIFLVKS